MKICAAMLVEKKLDFFLRRRFENGLSKFSLGDKQLWWCQMLITLRGFFFLITIYRLKA